MNAEISETTKTEKSRQHLSIDLKKSLPRLL